MVCKSCGYTYITRLVALTLHTKSTIKAQAKKGKKEKKKPGKAFDVLDDETAENGNIAEAKEPVIMTAEELVDDEWGPVKEKGKKKGKKGKGKTNEDIDEEPSETPAELGVRDDAKKPIEVTAEDLADEEWGPAKEKNKGKKGKKGKATKDDGEEEAKQETIG